MTKKIILIHGLPGSGKTTLADMLAFKLGATRVNADHVRENINKDLGFSIKDRIEQSRRMAVIANIALTGSSDYCVVDFVCPTRETREAFVSAADYEVIRIWMNTIDAGRFADTNRLYEDPYAWTDYTVQSYLDAQGFALKTEELALEIVANTIAPEIWYVRYNTLVGETGLRWRIINASTMEERLVEDFRVEEGLMFPASTFEHGVTKWNVAFSAVAHWSESGRSVVFK